MTNQEAADIVRTFRDVMDTPITEYREELIGALNMAIEALENPQVLYLCSREKEGCEKTSCVKMCNHTSDVRYAMNFHSIETKAGDVIYIESNNNAPTIKINMKGDQT